MDAVALIQFVSFLVIVVWAKMELYTPTLITAKGVIPAPYQVLDKLQRESRRRSCESRKLSLRSLDSPVSSTGQAYSSPE